MKRSIAFILLIISAFGMFSCGSDSPEPGLAGISFTLKWPDNTGVEMAGSISKAAPAGVATIRMSVSAPDMPTMSNDFPAASGSGTISSVPPGPNRTITFEGFDANGCAAYRGSEPGVTLAAGATYHCNDIVMEALEGCNAPPPITTLSITWAVIESGAVTGSSTNFNDTAAVAGQSDGVGFSSSANYKNYAGFSTTATGALMP